MQVVKASELGRREFVIEQILGFIRSAELRPGGRLPPEGELAESFGVSRTVVREAMQSLQATGAISVEQGRGTFVAQNPLAQPFIVLNELNRHRVEEVFEVRIILEGESAFRAAMWHNEDQLVAIKATLDDAWRHIALMDWAGAMDDDMAFHRAVTRATGLPLLQEMLEVAIPGWLRMNSNFAFEPDKRPRLETGTREHTAVYEAICEGDGPGARDAMHRHLRNSQQRRMKLMQSLPTTRVAEGG